MMFRKRIKREIGRKDAGCVCKKDKPTGTWIKRTIESRALATLAIRVHGCVNFYSARRRDNAAKRVFALK